ncbi:MAG: hypothetical protein NY202_01220 [Mollicutes bacterium UO1]
MSKTIKMADYANKILALIFIEKNLSEASKILVTGNHSAERAKIFFDILEQVNEASEDPCIREVFQKILDEDYKLRISTALLSKKNEEGENKEEPEESNDSSQASQ